MMRSRVSVQMRFWRAEPPRSVMNSRRRMSASNEAHKSSTSLDDEGAVHRSELFPAMTASGQQRLLPHCSFEVRFTSVTRHCQCPSTCRVSSSGCEQPQRGPLLDHLVGAREQRGRHREVEYPSGLGVDDEFEL